MDALGVIGIGGEETCSAQPMRQSDQGGLVCAGSGAESSSLGGGVGPQQTRSPLSPSTLTTTNCGCKCPSPMDII